MKNDKYTKKYFYLAKKILFPICRSLTGNGTKKTLNIIKKEFKNLKIKSIKSGTKVFDWKVPKEWNIQKAFVKDKNGKILINFKKNNLHIVSYSYPVNKNVKKNILLKRLHTSTKLKNAIPYVTSYYKKYWGFCVSHNEKQKLIKNYDENDLFKICIESTLKKDGKLNWGELVLKGISKEEILISTYICHPSMANNELSGPIVAMSLINFFKNKKLNKTLRFVFIPETIGSIIYINKNLKNLKKNTIGGFNLTCIGDDRNHSCMLSKYENSLSDKALIKAYKDLKIKFKKYSFLERGSDERQYNSPGIDLNLTSIFRSKYGEYPEYHTSYDDFNLVSLSGITGGFEVAKKAIEILQNFETPKAKFLCEPFMTKRKLYPTLSKSKLNLKSKKLMDFLQYSDGSNSLQDISKLIQVNIEETKKIYNTLKENSLLK
tara:strand:+ start:629 stop:1927 length:1299 start_codon:yes stop_codon:yes gene_type:complete